MRLSESVARGQIEETSRRSWERGWVANHDGNASIRLDEERILCTPTGISKAEVKAADLLVVDGTGQRKRGALKPFSELGLHLAWYRARPEIVAVLHAHPPVATGIGVAGRMLPHPFLPEAVVTLGPVVPTVPFALPGAQAEAAAAPYLRDHDVLLLAGNGVISCGRSLEQAYMRMELVEHLARIAQAAEAFGGVQKLPAHFLPPLLQARARAGLEAPRPALLASLNSSNSELEAIVEREIRRVL